MRLFLESQSTGITQFSGNITTTGTVTIPVAPYNSNDLVNKQYVDSSIGVINSSLSSHTGNSVIHLTPQQDTWLNNISIPGSVINFTSGLTSNLRSSIENLLSRSGGVLSGPLYQPGLPTLPNQLATKQYVDSFSLNGTYSELGTGAIAFYPSTVIPTGYLLCNGAQVSKTTYSNLYSFIGDMYSTTSNPGAGQPWRQQYGFNTTQSSDITGWTVGTSLPGVLDYSQAVVTKNRVYLLGGRSNGTAVSTVYTAPINSDGSLGAWTTGTSLLAPLEFHQAIVTNNRVYVLGGDNGIYSVASVYTAPINSDGTLGAWVASANLPSTLTYSRAIVTNNRVYLIGGYSNIPGGVYTAPINSDGTLGIWTTVAPLPTTVGGPNIVVTNSRVYVLGGYIGNFTANVYSAPINSDGTLGAWVSDTPIPQAITDGQSIVTSSAAYLLGGSNDSFLSNVYMAPINQDGTLGTWRAITSMPMGITVSQAIVTSSRVYMLGGNVSNGVYYANFSGGLNDYSPYYSGVVSVTDPNNFVLPNYSTLVLPPNMSTIIKT